jgi:hypothetical protein
VQSSVTPGVACNNSSGGSYDCIVAYVSPADTLNRVQVKRFRANAGATKYNLTIDPSVYNVSFAPTGSRIAAWFNVGTAKFYVATRPQRVNNLIEVFESSNGASWSLTTTLASSVTGPSAASYWEGGGNVLTYVR